MNIEFTDLQRMEFWLASLPTEQYEPIAACMKDLAVLADKYGLQYVVVAMMVMGYMKADDMERQDPEGTIL